MATAEQRTEQSLAAKVWGISVRKIVYMALGAALYGVLSVPTNFLQLPGNISIRPAIVIPLFFGAVFGPWVGLFSGAVGNFIGDLLSGYGVFWNWDVGNGLIGFIAGLAMYITWGSYKNTRTIAIAEVFAAIGVVVGIGWAAYSDIVVSTATLQTATTTFVTGVLPDIGFGLILLPILLVAYNATLKRFGRTSL
jgi:energy-coupling factor transport system substrate-specific component